MARKRKHRSAFPSGAARPLSSPSAPPLPTVPSHKFGEFKPTNVAPTPRPASDDEGFEVVPKRLRQYPSFKVSPQKLKSPVSLTDLQSLALWILADGVAPQWLQVAAKNHVRRVVVVMVPGLELGMFSGRVEPPGLQDGDEDMGVPVGEATVGGEVEWLGRGGGGWIDGDFYPVELKKGALPNCLEGFADMFTHAWPIKSPGDDRVGRLYSPIASFLNSPIPKTERGDKGNRRDVSKVGVTKLLMSLAELVENEYPIHSTVVGDADKAAVKLPGWVETDLSRGNDGGAGNEAGSLTEGKTIYAIDCEMCRTESDLELARISVVNWEGETVYDTLVKPERPITDYLTLYSGITKEKLDPITTTLKEVQDHLLTLLNNDTVLVGQSLNSDLNSMKIAHPHIVDTSVIYHHSRGPPFKPSLRWLSTKFLRRGIQSHGASGHDSIEDARATLDLLKLKLENGLEFGTSESMTESIFKRLSRMKPSERIGAVIDSGQLEKRWGEHAARRIVAETNSEVVEGVKGCVYGDPLGTPNGNRKMDFVWSHIRSLETLRRWNKSSAPGKGPPILAAEQSDPEPAALAQCIKGVTDDLKQIYDSLPPCSAFIVYSGSGDPREMRRLQDMQREFKKQYATTKWDELTVKWTDNEEQALKAAVKSAREGLGFMTVK